MLADTGLGDEHIRVWDLDEIGEIPWRGPNAFGRPNHRLGVPSRSPRQTAGVAIASLVPYLVTTADVNRASGRIDQAEALLL